MPHPPPPPATRRPLDRLPIRVRLAGVSALLTFVILCVFADAAASLTVQPDPLGLRPRRRAAVRLPSVLNVGRAGGAARSESISRRDADRADADHAVIRVFTLGDAGARRTSGPLTRSPQQRSHGRWKATA